MLKSRLLLSFFALFMIAAHDDSCEGTPPPQTGRSTIREMEQTEINQTRLARVVPPPQLADSQERRNLVRRLELVNNPNRVSWIHLMSNDGRIVFYTSVRGKVSSLNSLLTTPAQVVTLPIPCSGQGIPCAAQHVIPSPDFDGSYGENPHGIFWFDQAGNYMEWNGVYFLSDHPMRLAQEPVMVMTVDNRGNSTATPPPPPATAHP